MVAELEKVQGGEVSQKLESEVEVEREESRELDMNSGQDLPSGIDQNGEYKDDGDGSYVFITENDIVADESRETVIGMTDVGVRVSVGKEVVKEERENGAGGEQKDQSGDINDSSVGEVVGEIVVESEAEKGGDGVTTEEETKDPDVVVSVVRECELPKCGDGNVENDELEPAEMGEGSKDSQISIQNPPDCEIPEPASGEDKKKGQSDFAVDIEEKQDSNTVVTENARDDANQEKQPVSLDHGRESAELVNCEIPLEDPSGNVGADLEHSLQSDSGHAADIKSVSEAVRYPVSNENVDVQVKSEVVRVHASVENGDVPIESEVILSPAFDENGDATLESEAVRVPRTHENADAPLESDAVMVPSSDENIDVQLDPEAVRILASNENRDVQQKSEVVSITASDENGDTQSEAEVRVPASEENSDVLLESEAVQVSTSDENGDVQLESEAVRFPVADENDNVQLQSTALKVPVSDENDNVQLQYTAVKVPVSDENDNVQLESEVVRTPVSDENGNIQPESEAVETPVSDENGNVQLDSEAVRVSASDENGNVQLESEADRVPVSDENGNVYLESEAVRDPVSDENDNIQLESKAVRVPVSDENGNLEFEAIRGPVSDENGNVQLESEAIMAPVSDENANVHLESETIRIPIDDENGDFNLESQAVRLSASNQKDDGLLESETVIVPSPDENDDDMALAPTQGVVSGTAVTNDLVDANHKTLEQNGFSGHAEESFSDQCETVSTRKDEGFTTPGVNNTRTVLIDDPANGDLSEDTGLDMKQIPEEEPAVQSEPEISYDKGGGLTTGHDQGTAAETNITSEADAGQDTAEEANSLPPTGTCENVSVESGKTCPTLIDTEVAGSDLETNASKPNKNLTAATSDDVRSETTVVQSGVRHSQYVDSLTVDNSEVDIEVKDGPPGNQTESSSLESSCEIGKAESGTVCPPTNDTVPGSDSKNEVSNITENSAVGIEDDNGTEIKTVELDTKGSRPATESELLNGSAIKSEETSSTTNVVDESGQSADEDKDNKIACKEVDSINISQRDSPASSEEVSLADVSESHLVAEPEKKPFYYLIRVPRYDDENLKEQIKQAQLQVDKKTKSRDAIKVEIQKIKDSCNEHGDSLEAAVAKEKSARDLLRSKRQEMDSLQSKINVVKSITSVEDIDSRVRNMEHMIEHETLPLKEEKQLIREIKQLKQLREQITSNMGTQDEVQQALDQKDETEERLKVLRKEFSLLRANVLKAEAVSKDARKKRFDESDKITQLQDQFRAADAVRQEAFAYLQSLKKKSYEKNKYFYNYRDEAKAANDLALKGDKEALQRLCLNQVETFMNLWSREDEFRGDYIRCNLRSTLRRFRTLDGRSLGPDEEPPVIPPPASKRSEMHDSISSVPTLVEQKQKHILPAEEKRVVEDKPVTNAEEQKNRQTKSKKSGKSAPSASGSALLSGREDIEEIKEEEEHRRTKEEEEMARKAQELRKREEEVRVKEQRRLEEITKAKEALERKQRIAEKAKARAALRAQKEAEEKEKEREKRLRKKERRKAGNTTDDANIANEEQPNPVPETQTEQTPKEVETIQDTPTTPAKKPHKPSQKIKQSKSKSIPPPPLRNRDKRKIQPWMWVLFIALVVFALFFMGNSDFSLKSRLPAFGF